MDEILIKKSKVVDKIYSNPPKNLNDFFQKYMYFNPDLINNKDENIVVLNIINSDISKEEKIHKFNLLKNRRFRAFTDLSNLENNFEKYKRFSIISSKIIEDIIKRSKYSKDICNKIAEDEIVKNCTTFYELGEIYRNTNSKKIKYELLRKIGLIQIIAKIDKKHIIEEKKFAIDYIKIALKNFINYKKNIKSCFDYDEFKNLKKRVDNKNITYFFLDENQKVKIFKNEKTANKEYENVCLKREKLNLKIHPMQVYTNFPLSYKNAQVLDLSVRNKFECNSNPHEYNERLNLNLSYTSFVEKVIRKNLDFVKDIHDTIGIRIIVEKKSQIPKIINEINNYFGDITVRRREKNMYNYFEKEKLNEYSAKNYQVWKSISNVIVPHPYTKKIQNHINLLKNCKENPEIFEVIKKLESELDYYKDNPQSFSCEIQVQDLKSYLLTIVHRSRANHNILKMKQIRDDSFHKLFPKEIYKEILE